MIALLLLALAACSDSGIPAAARAPLSHEWQVLDDVRAAWEQRPLPPLSDECSAYLGRLHVVDADRETMLALCWRDEPGHCGGVEDASRSRYGCAAGCALVRSTCAAVGSPWWRCTPHPIAIIATEQAPEVRAAALRHEATHLLALGPCPRVLGSNDHTAPLLWGPGGVTPL